jgi:lipopolysaccharide/colanic/teichoic acid biosynthesis glycosyltransferase
MQDTARTFSAFSNRGLIEASARASARVLLLRAWADPHRRLLRSNSERAYAGGLSKRCLDVTAAAVLLVVLLPLLLLIGVLVVTETRGPPFFRQVRRGRAGSEFRIVKYRTMYVGAENQQRELAELSTADWPLFKIKGRDCRATRFGHVLRRSSLDELPQLWNVLLGHMSLVGPRPLALAEADLLPAAARRRFEARPGMTGLWQVNGRHRVGTPEMLALDLTYVDRCCISLDVSILLKTVPAVLNKTGAY